MLKIVNSSESLPAVPDALVIERFSDTPQRVDYVPPVMIRNSAGDRVMALNTMGTGFLDLLLDLHNLVEVNAVMPEHREMAARLRAILEGRS